MSKSFAQICDAYTAAKCKSEGASAPVDEPAAERGPFELCCKSEWIETPTPRSEWGKRSCEDADGDLKKKLLGADDQCCDACLLPYPNANQADAKRYEAVCTADGSQGPSVCGTDADDRKVVNTDVYFRGECSTGPDHTLEGAEEECEGGTCTREACTLRKGDLALYHAEAAKDEAKALPSGEVEGTAFNRVLSAATEFPFAFVMNGPGVVNRAKVQFWQPLPRAFG